MVVCQAAEVGFKFSDGRRVTNVDRAPWFEQQLQGHHRPSEEDDRKWEPAHPVLVPGNGCGSYRAMDQEYWLWPLPPAGSLWVGCEWPSHGIKRTVNALDAQPIVDAAARARPIWP